MIAPIPARRRPIRRGPGTALTAESREQIARAAHELNTPLSVVSGSLGTLEHYVVTLLRQCPTPPIPGQDSPNAVEDDSSDVAEKVLALLRLCREGARRLEHVARQFRSCSGAPSGAEESVDLVEIIQQSARFAAADAPPALVDLELGRDLHPVRGVAESLGQLFVNLVRNALEAVADEPEPRVWIRARNDLARPGWVEISVSDNGPGVSPEMQGSLFQPFRGTKGARGLGLGLAIAHDVVEQHRGSIELVPGPSARFVVRLPAEQPSRPVSLTGRP